MGNNNPDPTLNKVEGHFERDEDLEWDWDISDLREIPEEFQDWDDIWNSPQGCSDSLFSTPNYEHYSEGSLGEESDLEEYLEELQAVLHRTTHRYQSTWVALSSPGDEMEKKQRYTVEEARGQISMDQEEDLLSLRDLDQPIEVSCEIHQRPRTDLDIVAEMIEQEERTENMEKLNTEIKEQSCRTSMQSQRASKEQDELQKNEVVMTGESEVKTGGLVELLNRACGVQEPAKVGEVSSAKETTGDLVVYELEVRLTVPRMQVVKAFRMWPYASTYESRGWETRNEGWNKAKKGQGNGRRQRINEEQTLNENGAEQQVWPQPNDIGWGGCNGPGYYEGHHVTPPWKKKKA